MIEDFAPNPNVVAVVTVKDGQTFANSRDVAAYFHKQHKDVLKRYDTLECSTEFAQRNFALSMYEVDGGKGSVRQERSIDMTRDGFVFIAFGFTGKRAAKFKEGYIAAFNDMEAQLGRRAQASIEQPTGQLALALETNDSLSNIERHLHSIHTGLGAKIDAVVGAIIGSVIKHVARPILERLESNQRWNEERFSAIHRRDKLLIESIASKADAEECVSIAVAQTMMGVSASHRSSRLSRNLSANAIHWFVAHGFTARPDTSHASGPWVFQRSKVAEWWAASGKAIFDRAVPPKSADVLPFDQSKRGPKS